jgi:hypothetical protein
MWIRIFALAALLVLEPAAATQLTLTGLGTAGISSLTQLPGLKLSLDATTGLFSDAGVTPCADGSNVIQWNDISGNAKNATNDAGAASHAIYRANADFGPAVEFDGSGRLFAGANSDFAGQTFTMIVVALRTGTAGGQMFLSKGDGLSNANSTWELLAAEGGFPGVRMDTWVNTSGSSTGPGYTPSDSWEMVSVERLGPSAKNVYRNGVLMGTSSDGGTLNAGAAVLGIGNVGSSGTSATGLGFEGYFKAVAYFTPALSATDRAKAEQYLQNKFSVNPASPIGTNVTTIGALTNAPWQAQVFTATDAQNFAAPSGVTNPVFTFPGNGGTGTSSQTVGASLMFAKGKYWMVYEVNDNSGTQTTFSLASATSENGPWSWVQDVTVAGASGFVWNPHWFVDDDGSVHVNGRYGAVNPANKVFVIDATWNGSGWTFGTASQIFSTLANVGDNTLLSPGQNPTGQYALWYRNENFGQGFIEYATSPTLRGTYTTIKSGNWLGLGSLHEGITPVKISGSTWRLFTYPTGISNGWQFIDSYDNWATWQNIVKSTSFTSTTIITADKMSIGPN